MQRRKQRNHKSQMADEKTKQLTAEQKLTEVSQSVRLLLDRIVAWENYWKILKSKGLLLKHNKRWNALAKAAQLRYALLQDINRFESEKAETARNIAENNPRLAGELEKFKTVPENTLPRMAHLLAELNNDPKTAESSIRTHGLEIIAGLNSLKNGKDADDVRRLVIEISGAEVAEIVKCIADLEAWQSFRVGNNVQFFQNRVKIYIGGGKSESRDFPGLGKFFKDWKLVNEIKESIALKMLLSYQRQLQWFENARKVVLYASLRPGWGGFLDRPKGFYWNLTEGQNYIKMIKHVFGNKDIAEYLESVYNYPEGPGQVPKLWLPHMDEILSRIKNPTFVNRDVILPAQDDLKRIFERIKEELSAIDINGKLEELKGVMRRFFREAVRQSKNLRGSSHKKMVPKPNPPFSFYSKNLTKPPNLIFSTKIPLPAGNRALADSLKA